MIISWPKYLYFIHYILLGFIAKIILIGFTVKICTHIFFQKIDYCMFFTAFDIISIYLYNIQKENYLYISIIYIYHNQFINIFDLSHILARQAKMLVKKYKKMCPYKKKSTKKYYIVIIIKKKKTFQCPSRICPLNFSNFRDF